MQFYPRAWDWGSFTVVLNAHSTNIINGHITQAFMKYDDSVYLGGFWLQQIQVELSCI